MQFDLRPMLVTLTDKPFDDPDWVFETKWDGFRAIAVAKPGQATLYSRKRHIAQISFDQRGACQNQARSGARRRAGSARRHGRSRFQLLPNAEREPARLLYC